MPNLEFEGRRVHWEAYGSGPPVLFLHEWNSSSDLFRDQALDEYRDHHRVLLIDLPGFGRSEPWDTLDMARLSRFLGYLLDVQQISKVSLLGFCLGAILALDFTLRWPSRVERLVLVDVLIRFPPLLQLLLIPLIGPLFLDFFSRNPLGSALSARVLARTPGFERFLAQRFQQAQLPVSYNYLRMLREYGTIDHLTRVERLEVPVLCLASGAWILPFGRCAQDLVDRLPQGQIGTVPGSRHYTLLAAPRRMSPRILQFLGDQSGGLGHKGLEPLPEGQGFAAQ